MVKSILIPDSIGRMPECQITEHLVSRGSVGLIHEVHNEPFGVQSKPPISWTQDDCDKQANNAQVNNGCHLPEAPSI